MRGCLSLPFRLAFAALVVLAGWIAWEQRDRIRRWIHEVTDTPAVEQAAVPPYEERRRTGLARLDSLRRGRADSVVLTAPEVEALFVKEIEDRSDRVLDSASVRVQDGTVAVRARLDADRLPPGVMSQLAQWVAGRETVEARGTLRLRRLGVGELEVSQLRVRGVPLPRAAWTRLVESAMPEGEPGVVTFPVPEWVTGIRTSDAGIVMYGRGDG
jgi:hypothetical protein